MDAQKVVYLVGVACLFLAGFKVSGKNMDLFSMGWAFLALGYLFL